MADGGVAGSARRGHFARDQSRERDVRESLITPTAGRDEERVTTDDGIVGSFAGPLMKHPLPQNRLGIAKVALDQEVDFLVGSGEIDDGGEFAKAMQDVIAGTNYAASRVDDEFAMRVSFEGGQEIIERGDFFAQVFGFTLTIRGTVGPSHPSSDAVDPFVATCFEDWGETGFNLIVTADRGTSEGIEIFDPMRLAGPGHANEREAKGLVGIRPHGELMILRNGRA